LAYALNSVINFAAEHVSGDMRPVGLHLPHQSTIQTLPPELLDRPPRHQVRRPSIRRNTRSSERYLEYIYYSIVLKRQANQ